MTLNPGFGSVDGLAHAQPKTATVRLSANTTASCANGGVSGASVVTLVSMSTLGGTAATHDGAASTARAQARCPRVWHVDATGYLLTSAPFAAAYPLNEGIARETIARRPRAAPTVTVTARPLKKVVSAPIAPPRQVKPAPAPPVSAAPPVPSGPYNAWAPVPGHPGYAMGDFAGDPWGQYFGVCTWYAWDRHQNEPLLKLGNAAAWASSAHAYGLATGTTPAVGATAVFQPGVEGAGGGGHVAHVEAVLGGGWFLVSEMNFGINGGGWGRVDWRYAYVAPGVSFIY